MSANLPRLEPILPFQDSSHEEADDQGSEIDCPYRAKELFTLYLLIYSSNTPHLLLPAGTFPPVFPAQRLLSILPPVPEGEGESGVDDLMVERIVYTHFAIHAETVHTIDWENVDSARQLFRLVIPAKLLRGVGQVGEMI